MSIYKLKIENREYTEISVVDAYTLKPKPIPRILCPIKNKLFNHDIFDISSTSINTGTLGIEILFKVILYVLDSSLPG